MMARGHGNAVPVLLGRCNERDWGVRFSCGVGDEFFDARLCRTGDDFATGDDDACFFVRDFLDRVAEHVGVVQVDIRNYRNVLVRNNVRTVKASTKPHFQHAPLHAGVCKRNERNARCQFEKREGLKIRGNVRLVRGEHVVNGVDQVVGRDELVVYAVAFEECGGVW